MHLDAVLGMSLACERLKMLVTAKNFAHLYLFVAPTAERASSVARAFLLDWLGALDSQSSHPDFFELSCSGKAGLHSVEKVRELLADISLSPHMPRGRAIFINSAERMLPSSSNTLLKALEEPPPRTIIVLTTNALQKILPTIVSRAQIIRLPDSVQAAALDLSPVLQAPSYRTIHAFTEELCSAVEEEKASLAKELQASHPKDDLPAAARHEIEQEMEAALTLFSHQRGQQLLEQTYLALRSRESCSVDLTKALLQSLKAIERGSDLKRIFPLFLAKALLCDET